MAIRERALRAWLCKNGNNSFTSCYRYFRPLAAKARPRVHWVTLFCTGGGKIVSNCYDYLHSANHTLGGTR